MLALSVIAVFLLLGALWLAAVVHEHGLTPVRDVAALMRRPAAELAFVALIVGGFIHHGATKGTNGVNGASGEMGDRGMSGEVGGLRNLPQVQGYEYSGTNDVSGVTNLCFMDIVTPDANSVAFSVAWPTNWSLPELALLLYARHDLDMGGWNRLAAVQVPDGVNAVDVEVPRCVLPEGGTNRAFFTIGTLDDSDGDGIPDSDERLVYGTNPNSADSDGDWVLDGDELSLGSDPCSNDTDGDGIRDAEELGWIAVDPFPDPMEDGYVITNLTQAFLSDTQSCVDVALPVGIAIPGETFQRMTIDPNGLVHLYGTGGTPSLAARPYCQRIDSVNSPSNTFSVAAYWTRLALSTNEPASSVKFKSDYFGLFVEFLNMRVAEASLPENNRVSFQVYLPEQSFPRFTVKYGIVGNDAGGRYASVGAYGRKGAYRRSFCYLQANRIIDGMTIFIEPGYGTNPLAIDSDSDGIGDGAELALGTRPDQPDTDGDGMDDGWEQRYGFDPCTHNSETTRTDDDGTADPDGDGLTNAEEYEWDTNPHVVDSDGDGVGDGAEVGQNSDPADVTDGGVANSRVPVPVCFGDYSGSHSEKYILDVGPGTESGEGTSPRAYSWLNAQYGECETKTAMLKPGWKYEVTLRHSSTKPNCGVFPCPDYDYMLSLVTNGLPPNVALYDPDGLFGRYSTSYSFSAVGKVAYIHVLAPPEIVAPETVGMNQDDDNGNGTPDFDDVGEVVGDDDLVEMKVRVRCPAGLSGTVTVDVYGYLLNGRMWRDRARTQRVETQDTFTVNGDTERSYYVEGETFSVGHLTESFRVRFQCLGKTLASEHRFTFVYRIAEPITTERVGGNLVNPCCAIVGANTPMRIDVRPQGFPDSKIKWSVVSGTGTFAGADTGRDVSFVAGGSDGDSVTLKVEVGDCPGAPPQFTMRTTAMHEVKIYPCAISRMGRPSPITDAHVASLLDGVNAIFRQVGLHFSLGAPVMNVTNNTWAINGLIENYIGAQIRNVMSGTDGLEVYFIAGSGNDDEPVGLYNAYGIILRNSADAIALAHEIGHSCGWPDIYFYRGSVVPSELNQKLRATWMPNDWNNGSGCRFYAPILSQRDIIQRLLMNGVKVDAQSDIPLGSVFGLSVDNVTGMMNVGRNGILTVSPQSN